MEVDDDDSLSPIFFLNKISFKYEQHELKYNNALVPLYFIVEFKGCKCQMENYIGQLQSSIYGIPFFYPSIVGQKMKLKIHGCPTEFINKKGTWVCYCECSQSKIKTCMQIMSRLNDIGKLIEVHQFGGKKLDGDKLAEARKPKGKELKKFECECPEQQEYKYNKSFKLSNKKEMMANYMFQLYRCNQCEIKGDELIVKSMESIKSPTQANLKRFMRKFESIDAGKEQIYYQQQGMLCGFWY